MSATGHFTHAIFLIKCSAKTAAPKKCWDSEICKMSIEEMGEIIQIFNACSHFPLIIFRVLCTVLHFRRSPVFLISIFCILFFSWIFDHFFIGQGLLVGSSRPQEPALSIHYINFTT